MRPPSDRETALNQRRLPGPELSLRDVLELGAELFGGLGNHGRQTGQDLRVLEILVTQADHVATGNFVLL